MKSMLLFCVIVPRYQLLCKLFTIGELQGELMQKATQHYYICHPLKQKH